MKKTPKKIFEDLKQSLDDALAYEQGKKTPLRVTELSDPPNPNQGNLL